jgi:hypothetical protein
MRALLGESIDDVPVERALDDVARKREVRIDRREVLAASHDECLRERRLGAVVRLLDDAILVRLAGPNARRDHAIVIEYSAVAIVERTPRALLELVRRRRQVVRTVLARYPAQRPHGSLEPADERLVGL